MSESGKTGTGNNRRKHRIVKTGLCVAGAIIALAGVVLTVIGFYFFYNKESNLQFAAFIGVSFIIVGMFLVLFSFQRELSRYKKGENTVIFESENTDVRSSYIPPAEEKESAVTVVCECGTVNDSDALYCKKCGKSLHSVCPFCGEEVDSDSEYCKKCGKRLTKE